MLHGKIFMDIEQFM